MAQITQESRESQRRGELEELRTLPGLPFQQLLDVQKIQAALDACECSFRVRVFDPFQTLWAFLSQVYAGETSSCQDAVSRLQADRAVKKLPPISSDTSSYCEARARLHDARWPGRLADAHPPATSRGPRPAEVCQAGCLVAALVSVRGSAASRTSRRALTRLPSSSRRMPRR